jgi:hypothetical protein
MQLALVVKYNKIFKPTPLWGFFLCFDYHSPLNATNKQTNNNDMSAQDKREASAVSAYIKGNYLWSFQTWTLKGASVAATSYCVWTLPVSVDSKMLLAMGYLCSTASVYQLSKLVRDRAAVEDARKHGAEGGNLIARKFMRISEGTQWWGVWCWGSFAAFNLFTEYAVWNHAGSDIATRQLLTALHMLVISTSSAIAKQLHDSLDAWEIRKAADAEDDH